MPLGLQAKKVAATEQSPPLVKQPSLQHSSSSDGVSTSSTSGSLLKQSSQSKLSARAPAAKMKPRTLLYVIFAVVSLNQLLYTVVHARVGMTLQCYDCAVVKSASKTACAHSVRAATGAVYQGYIKKVEQLQMSLGNAVYSLSFQRYVASNGNRSADATSFNNTDRLLRHIQSIYNIEYLTTIVNTTKHIMYSVNADRQGEVFDPAGVVTAAGTSGVTVYGSGAPVWSNALLTYEELLKENPPVIRDRCVYNGLATSFSTSSLQLKNIALLALLMMRHCSHMTACTR
eukprot:20773-Heterococcus_DN1.PRE.1